MRAVLAVVVAGCAGADAMTLPAAAPQAVANTEVGLVPGENMAFEIKLAGIIAGEAQLAVGEATTFEGHRAIIVKSRAATAGAAALLKKITDEATTTIDLDTGRPLTLETFVEMGDRTSTASARFVGSRADITYTRDKTDKPHTMRIDFGKAVVNDAHAAMAQLRGWKAKPGTTKSLFVVGGRRLWRVDVKFAGEATIASAYGNRRAVRYEGAAFRAKNNLTVEGDKPQRTFTVWLSDDADRVPLKVAASTELGDIAIELTEYTRP
jgi:hypothetical protein